MSQNSNKSEINMNLPFSFKMKKKQELVERSASLQLRRITGERYFRFLCCFLTTKTSGLLLHNEKNSKQEE